MAGRLLGVDYGRVRLGVAVSDPLGVTTTPLGHVPREGDDAKAAAVVAALAAREQVTAIVVGVPVRSRGEEGASAGWARAFAAELARRTALPIHGVDESHSSAEAEEALIRAGRWPAQPGQVDARSAAILLRRWLDGVGRLDLAAPPGGFTPS